MKKLTEKIYIFLRMLDLILDAIKSVLFQIAVGFIIIISIIKFVDTTWLRWLLLVMSGGALFYSVYDDLVLYLRKEFIKTLSKLLTEIHNCIRARCPNIFRCQFIPSYDLYKSINNLNLFYSFVYYPKNLWKILVTTNI